MLNNDACVGWSPLTSEVPKDRVMVISLMVGCWRTQAETGIVWMEKGSVRLVMLMINCASAERLGQRQRQSWICDTERNSLGKTLGIMMILAFLIQVYMCEANKGIHKRPPIISGGDSCTRHLVSFFMSLICTGRQPHFIHGTRPSSEPATSTCFRVKVRESSCKDTVTQTTVSMFGQFGL